MATTIVGPNGTVTVSVPASARVACYSDGPIQIIRTITSANYPEMPSEIESVSSGRVETDVFSTATEVDIISGGSVVYYEVGTDAVVKRFALPASTAVNVTGAVSAAAIFGGLVTSTTAAAVAGTIPTGAVLDDASTWDVGDYVEWSVINTGGNTFTVTAATGHTITGSAAVATITSGRFQTRKTAADTFVTSRLS